MHVFTPKDNHEPRLMLSLCQKPAWQLHSQRHLQMFPRFLGKTLDCLWVQGHANFPCACIDYFCCTIHLTFYCVPIVPCSAPQRSGFAWIDPRSDEATVDRVGPPSQPLVPPAADRRPNVYRCALSMLSHALPFQLLAGHPFGLA